jgi:AAHS family 4-hydroxybenzoate transporter-like MFS transporter
MQPIFPSIAPAGARPVDVVTALNEAPFTALHRRAILLALLILMLDGFDIQAVAFAAPALTSSWHIARAQLAPVLTSGLIGMAIGAGLLGRLADHFGRKRMLFVTVLLLGGGSLLCAAAQTPTQLEIFRLLTGLGLGAPLPLATALLAEFSPRSSRNLYVGLGCIGIPLGGLAGAAIAQQLVPEFGWPSIFVFGGLLPLALLLPLWHGMVESPRFLARRPQDASQLADLLNRMTASRRYGPHDRFFITEAAVPERAGLSGLMNEHWMLPTLALWSAFFANVFVVYIFFSWLPTLLASVGLTMPQAIHGSLLFNLGGLLGVILTAIMSTTRFARLFFFFVIAVAIGMLWSIGQDPVFTLHAGATSSLSWSLIAAGFGVNGAQLILYLLATSLYPTALRATGVGLASGVSRFGGVCSGVFGGLLLAQTPGTMFSILAAIVGIVFLATLGLQRHLN